MGVCLNVYITPPHTSSFSSNVTWMWMKIYPRTKNTRVKRGLSTRGRRMSFWPSKVQEGNVLRPMFCHYNGGLSGRCGPILQEQPLKAAVVTHFHMYTAIFRVLYFNLPRKGCSLETYGNICCPYSTGHVNHSEAFPIVRMSLSCSTLVFFNFRLLVAWKVHAKKYYSVFPLFIIFIIFPVSCFACVWVMINTLRI